MRPMKRIILIQFFAKYFGGSYDLKSISRNKFIVLIILFKRMMKQMGYIYIHQIMTGNVSKTIKRRKVSTKQLSKIKSNKLLGNCCALLTTKDDGEGWVRLKK